MSQAVTETPFPHADPTQPAHEHGAREPTPYNPIRSHTNSSSSSISDADQPKQTPDGLAPVARPRLGSRKSSGTIIIPRDSPNVELKEEEYDDGDARTMSPRRSSEEIERMGQEARQALIEQAKALQQSLMQIVDRVEIVKSEHEKLEGGNKFLQSYIGELMQTSKITSSGAARNKAKNKNRVIK